MLNEDGTINLVWNEFFVRLMVTAGVTVDIASLEADIAGLQAQIEALGGAASSTVLKSDSEGTATAVLDTLYDGTRTSGGVEYTVSGTDKYIQYEFGIENYFDRIGLWTSNANGRIYVAYSSDAETWSYLSAESDHTLDSTGKLVTATSQSNAAADYLQLVEGFNLALFPSNTFAKYIRLYLTGSYTTTIYEFVASRILISELAVIDALSTQTANIGTVTAGVLESATRTTSGAATTKIDLNAGIMYFYDESDVLRVKIGDLS
jgi:hypothetical protein